MTLTPLQQAENLRAMFPIINPMNRMMNIWIASRVIDFVYNLDYPGYSLQEDPAWGNYWAEVRTELANMKT